LSEGQTKGIWPLKILSQQSPMAHATQPYGNSKKWPVNKK